MNIKMHLFIVQTVFLVFSLCAQASPQDSLEDDIHPSLEKLPPALLVFSKSLAHPNPSSCPPPADVTEDLKSQQKASPPPSPPSFTAIQQNNLRILGLSTQYADGDDLQENSPLSWRERLSISFELEVLIRNAVVCKRNLSLLPAKGSEDIMLRVQMKRGPANFSLKDWKNPEKSGPIMKQLRLLQEMDF